MNTVPKTKAKAIKTPWIKKPAKKNIETASIETQTDPPFTDIEQQPAPNRQRADRQYDFLVTVGQYSDPTRDVQALGFLNSVTTTFINRLMGEGDLIAHLGGQIVIKPMEHFTRMELILPGDNDTS